MILRFVVNRSLAVSVLVLSAFSQNHPCLGAQQAEAAAVPDAHSLTYLLEGKGFAAIPAGEFIMGSDSGNADEAPPHRVRIPKTFDLMRLEVTQVQWQAVMDRPHAKPTSGEEAREVEPSNFKGPSRPVEHVSWEQVQVFIGRLNARDPRYAYRLPTEAEWEYAAKAGAKAGARAKTDAVAWCASTSGGQTHTVGSKPANAWGLHDMLGNVMEWVADWYAPDAYAASLRVGSPRAGTPDPAANQYIGGSYRVYRGGAWLSEEKQCRPEFRGFDFPTNGYDSVGFRLVRSRR